MSNEYCMYLRKSRADLEAESRGEGETLARHQAMLAELAERRNLNVVRIYREIVSGDSIAARPQMQAMLSDITEKKYAGVLVVEIERLARGDTIDQGVVAQAFRQSDTKIITPVKTYDPSDEFDEEYFEFSLFMSRREYKTIKRRMQTGRLASVKEGNYICSRTPYGYRKISPEPKVHTLETVPEEAEVIRMIFNTYLNGHGAGYIANELNRLGIKPQKSDYWGSSTIKKILSNPLYCGKLGWKSKSNGDTLYDGKHEAIISEEIFQAAQQKKKNNPAAQLSSGSSLKNYYHGILFCKNCGHQLKRRCTSGYGCEYLLCTYSECRGKTAASPLYAIDEAVLTALRFRTEQLTYPLKKKGPIKNIPPAADIKKTLTAALDKAKNQKARLYDLLEQGVYDTDTFYERSQILDDKIRQLESSVREIAAGTPDDTPPPGKAITRLMNVIDRFPDASPEDKNLLLKSITRKMYYSKAPNKQRNSSGLIIDIDFL